MVGTSQQLKQNPPSSFRVNPTKVIIKLSCYVGVTDPYVPV